MTQATRVEFSGGEQILCMALELASRVWKLAFGVGRGQRARRRTVSAGDVKALEREILLAKQRLGLPASAVVVSCYEAGRDGFWIDRMLRSLGIRNLVIDASSTQVDRRRRRAKTDRLDAEMLLDHLLRHVGGERKVFRVVRVPSVEAEDARHLQRELEVLKRDRARISNRIRSLLATQGAFRIKVSSKLLAELGRLRLWDGSGLPPGLLERLKLGLERWTELSQRIREQSQRREQLLAARAFGSEQARRLEQVKSIGQETAWSFSVECFAHRRFDNGRQVGSFVGLSPTPYQSGQSRREQGISKAGNVRMRWRAIELSWLWLRYQPNSKLSLWFNERFGPGSKRNRRIGIVALARKLVIALWRYLEYGIVPEGATLKA